MSKKKGWDNYKQQWSLDIIFLLQVAGGFVFIQIGFTQLSINIGYFEIHKQLGACVRCKKCLGYIWKGKRIVKTDVVPGKELYWSTFCGKVG